ncbi:flavonol synthase [Dorcoceras hygrometricum]|uniref:Flavonol synthase n=1 Tax=Dorcoceras hygrometricum TaxID=472368 RepID=A0A2Z7BFK9_9LAMI|nr:flavonol synthase [Dorcoceras hygrometricum]
MEVERVQSISHLSKHAGTIPPEFIRSENEQPAVTTLHGVSLQVPVIDLHSNDEENLVKLVAEASKEWGIFQVVKHGIPDEVIAKLQSVGREFFELPNEEKELVAKTSESGIEGYGTSLQKEVEGKKGWVDHLFHKIWPPREINYRFWPKNPPEYRSKRDVCRETEGSHKQVLLKWLSLGLGLQGHELKAGVGGDDAVFLMKINFYPPCPRPDLALGVVAHTDMSSITILVPNEVQGLQVFRDGHWYDVKYIPNALIVHIGDQIEILSNGEYKAVLHRSTVNKDQTRMSWPVFIEPPPEFEVGPIAELCADGPSKYKTKKYKDYVYCKLNKIPQ